MLWKCHTQYASKFGKLSDHRTGRGQFSFFFFFFSFISWRLITLQHCSGFCYTLTWISQGVTCIPHPDPPPTSLSTWFLWVFPVHQARALVSCIPPGLVICFTIDNTHAVLSKHPTLTFSHRVQKSVLYICVSFSGYHYHLSKFHIYVLVCCNVLCLSGLNSV